MLKKGLSRQLAFWMKLHAYCSVGAKLSFALLCLLGFLFAYFGLGFLPVCVFGLVLFQTL